MAENITKAERIIQMEKQAIKDALQGNLNKYIDSGITPKHFSKFKTEWEWVLKTDQQYGKPPTLDSFGYQFPALMFPERTDATELIIEQLDKEYKFNVVAPGVNDLVKAMREGRTTEGLDHFIALVNQANGSQESGVINLYQAAPERLKSYEESVANPQRTISYGFPEIDKLTGGLWKSDLVIIAGKPGTGKSLCGLDSARCVAGQGYKVGYFNGEMGEDELGYRLDTLETHISNFAISNGKAGRDGSILEEYRKAAPKIANKKAELIVVSRTSSSVKITPSYLEKFCKRYGIEVLYIDQFSLLDSTSRQRETSEIKYELVRELSIIKKRLGIPIVLLAQIKRQDKVAMKQIKDGEPKFDTSDLSQTRGLEEFGTVIIMIDQKYEKDEHGRIMMNLYFAKNRHGEKEHILTYAWNIDKGERSYIKSNKALPCYNNTKSSKPYKEDNDRDGTGELPF